jgi:hypothetical protein
VRAGYYFYFADELGAGERADVLVGGMPVYCVAKHGPLRMACTHSAPLVDEDEPWSRVTPAWRSAAMDHRSLHLRVIGAHSHRFKGHIPHAGQRGGPTRANFRISVF